MVQARGLFRLIDSLAFFYRPQDGTRDKLPYQQWREEIALFHRVLGDNPGNKPREGDGAAFLEALARITGFIGATPANAPRDAVVASEGARKVFLEIAERLSAKVYEDRIEFPYRHVLGGSDVIAANTNDQDYPPQIG